MMPIVYLFGIIVVLYAINYYRNRRLFALGNKFSGPISIPFVGNLFSVLGRKPDNVIEFFKQTEAKYGKIARFWMGNRLSLVVTDPCVAEAILPSSTHNLQKNSFYRYILPWLGEGLLISTGKKWHNRRKIITPAFHFQILEQFIEIFDKQSQILVKQLEREASGNVFNIYPYLNLMTLDVVSETAMGTPLHAQTITQSKYVHAIHTMTRILADRFSNVWLRNDFLYSIFAPQTKRYQDEAIKVMKNFTETIIIARRQKIIDDNLAETVHTNEFGVKKKMAFLDIMLNATIDGMPLSDKDIREEVDTFMFEGHDTTTAGITFALYLLSRHKNIQDKLFEEIKEVLGTDRYEPVTHRKLQELKYMELVIKETLRMFPPVPGIGRLLDTDTALDDGRILPAKTNLSISFVSIFRDANYFPNPDKFDPERFRHENNIENKSPFVYIPFSAGSRNCIGQKFAMLEMKSAISKILRYYELLNAGPDVVLVFDMTLRSKNGINLGLKPRNY